MFFDKTAAFIYKCGSYRSGLYLTANTPSCNSLATVILPLITTGHLDNKQY